MWRGMRKCMQYGRHVTDDTAVGIAWHDIHGKDALQRYLQETWFDIKNI